MNNIKKEPNSCVFMTFLHKVIILTLCLSFLLVINNSAIASNNKSVFNIDVYFGWGGFFRPMEWTPIEITINNALEQPFGGELTVTSQQDGLNTMNIMVDELALTPELTEYLPLVTKISYTNQRCSLKLDRTTGRRKTVWTQDYDILMSQGTLPAINEYDMLIGVIGAGKFGVLGLEKQTSCNYKGTQGSVLVGSKQASMVPWDWTGFVSLDMLIMYDPDWSQLNEQQLKAIAQWITNGGNMLLVLGSKPPMGDNPLTEILPFEYLDAKEVEISRQQLSNWKLSVNSPEKVNLKPIVPKPGVKSYEGDMYQDNQYLFAIGNAGFGNIGVLGFDPENFSYSQDTQKSVFWVNLIKRIMVQEGRVENTILAQRIIEYRPELGTNINQFGQPNLAQQKINNRNYYQIASTYSMNNKVMEFLYQEIKPLSVWFVILLLGALAILLGPVDYHVLKRIDRLPLTWLTCTFWIIVFTVGAYYGVQYLRGGKTHLRVVSVIDGIKDENVAWSTQYSGLFASKSDSYKLENLQPDQWWSGIAPTQDRLYSYQAEIGSRRIYCTQENGGNLPESLPVNIWDIQCMLTESPIETMPFTADVRKEPGQVIVTIKNDSDAAIIDGYVMVDKNNGIRFDAVPANSTQEFKKNIQSIRSWQNDINSFTQISQYSGNSYGSFKNEAAYFAQGSLQRTQAMNNYLNKGASIVFVTYDNAPVSFKIKKSSVVEEHIQLARLVVFPN